jgi:hypothetical protein
MSVLGAPRSGHSALVLLCALGAIAPAAQATSIDITGNTTSQQTLSGADTLTVEAGASLATATSGASPTIKWNGASGTGPSVTNNGTISNTYNTGSSSGRAIDASVGASTANISFSLSNAVGAVISAVNDVFRVNRSIGTGGLTVNNAGTMQSTGDNGNTNGQVLDFNGNSSTTGSVTINNHGTMSAADADAIRPGNGSIINNWGSIAGHTSGDTGNDGIDYQNAGYSGTVNNYGAGASITGARHGITAKEAITVYNEGVIEGMAGSGLNIDNTTNSPVMSVINAAGGRIIGNSVAGADGDGIDIDHLANIVNQGTIQAIGLAASPNLNEAIAIGGGVIDNQAGGTIVSDQRAITVDDSNAGNAFGIVSIHNAGTISGANGEAILITSILDDMLSNEGTINGSVAMGNGADTIDLYTGSTLNGLLDGGGGVDTLHLMGSGNGRLGDIGNIETLSVEGGHWTLDGVTQYLLQSLELSGGDLFLASPDGARIITGELLGADLANGMVNNLASNGADIYYDPTAGGNGYLGGLAYHMTGGGLLRPVPEPGVLALLAGGLGLLGYTRRRERRETRPGVLARLA